MNNVDMKKLEAAVVKMVEDTLAVGKTICMYDQHRLLLSMQVSSMKSRHMHSEVTDVLSGSAFCSKYGVWVTGEYESDVRYLVRLTAPKQSIESVSYRAVHDTPPRAARKSQFTLEVPKGISEEQAQKLITQACNVYLNTGTIDELMKAEYARDAEKPRS